MYFTGGFYINGGVTVTLPPAASESTPVSDSYFKYNALLLSGNGTNNATNATFLDSSTNNFTITRNGNTTQGSFSPYGGNWSNYFGGQMYAALGSASTQFNLTGDFTLEAYVFLTALPGGDWGIFDARVSGATPAAWLYFISGGGKITFYEGTARTGATTVTLNTWHHVAWVRNGSALRGYLDGVLDYYNGSYGTGAISPGSTTPIIGTKDYGISAAWGTTGYISNLRVVNGTAVYTTSSTTVGATIFTPSTTPLTPITNTVLLTCQNNGFSDSSINNFSITPSSSTITTQRFSPFNPSSLTPTSYSGYFDGTGDYLAMPSNATSLAMGTGNFTIEFWINTSTIAQTGYVLQTDIGENSLYISLSGSTIRLTNAATVFAVTPTLSSNTWYHIAVVRSGTSSVIYTNGVAGTAVTCSTDFTQNGPTIGANSFVGYISNLRVVKGTAVYTTNFTPSTTPLTAITNTSLLTCQSTTFIDNSTNNFTITAYGNSKPTIQNPFGYTSTTTNGYSVSTIGGSIYFDGTGDYLTLPSSSNLAFGTGDFCVELWYYPTSATAAGLFSNSASSGGGDAQFEIQLDPTNLYPRLVGWASIFLTASAAATPNSWNHLAVSRSGTTAYIFLNGTQVATGTVTNNFSSTNSFNIGRQAANSGYFTGYISNVRAVKGSAVYTSNFIPPAVPLTAITNTQLLLSGTNAGMFDAAMIVNTETVGDAKISTAQSKFGGSSMYFDGTGDYLTIPTNPVMDFGTGDFTIEAWVRPGQLSTDWFIISSSGSGGFFFGYAPSTAGYGWGRTAVAWDYQPSTTATLNTWQHVAVSRSGTSMRIFVDGVQQGTTQTNSTSYNLGTTSTTIGSQGTSYYMTGYMNDLRVTKGYARYTANFTPPTAALETF